MKKQLTLKKLSLFVLTALLFVLLSLAFAFTGTARAYADGDGQPCPDGQHRLGDIFVIEKQTCVSHGVGVRYCKECGLSFNVVIPADGISHKVGADGTCTECGAEKVHYVITENLPEEDYVEVGQVQESEVTEITIPASVTTRGEKKEVHIAEGAFEGNETIQSVTILGTPEIGAEAFKGCKNLTNVTMEAGTQNIAADAFVGTKFYEDKLAAAKGTTEKDKLQSISIPISQKVGDEYQPTESYYLLKVIDPTAETKPESKGRRNAAALAEETETPKTFTYTVDPGTKVIAEEAFAGLANLVEVTLNPDLLTVGADAFYGCDALKTVYIAKAAENKPPVTTDSFTNVKGLAPFTTIYYWGSPDGVTVKAEGAKEDDPGTYVEFFQALANVIRYYSENEPTDNTHTYWHMVGEGATRHPEIWNKAVEIQLDTSHCTTRFRKGETFSSDGLVVKVRYENETQPKELTEAQQANLKIDNGGYVATELGEYTVTVTYLTYLKATYTVTVADAYTITINYGYNEKPSETALVFVEDGYVLPTAPERTGYKFLGWRIGSTQQVLQAKEEFTPTADTTITAQWEQLYTVTATGDHASTTLLTGEYYESGKTVSFSVTVSAGYKLVSVSNGKEVLTLGTDGKYSVTVGRANIVITIETTAVTVTATAKEGSVTKEQNGDKVTFTLTPPTKEGYRFDGWTAQVGTAAAKDFTDNTYTLSLGNDDVTVAFTARWTEMVLTSVSATLEMSGNDLTLVATVTANGFTTDTIKDVKLKLGDGTATAAATTNGYTLTYTLSALDAKADGYAIQFVLELTGQTKNIYRNGTITCGADHQDYNGKRYALADGKLTVTEPLTVTFVSDHGTAPAQQSVFAGETLDLTKITEPTATGYVFLYWYTLEGTTETQFDLTTPVTKSMTLHAKMGDEVTASVSIEDYAVAHDWAHDSKYFALDLNNHITVTASADGGYTGRYWDNDKSWRFYQSGGGSLTIAAPADGSEIKIVSVKIVYSNSNKGVLYFNSEQYSSNTSLEVNAASVTLTVGQTQSDDKNNGAIFITSIEVTYGVVLTEQEKIDMQLAQVASEYTVTEEGDYMLPASTNEQVTFTWEVLTANSYTLTNGNALHIDVLPVDADKVVKLQLTASCGQTTQTKNVTVTVKKTYNYGSENAPLTVAEALELARNLCANPNDVTSKIVYVTGVAESTPTTNGSYYNEFNLKGPDGSSIIIHTSNLSEGVSEPAQNDTLKIHGYIKNYEGKFEFASNNGTYVYIYERIAGQSTITLEANGATVEGITSGTKTNDDTVSFTVQPAEGKKVYNVLKNGEVMEASETGYSFTVAGDATIQIVQIDANATVAQVASLTFAKDGNGDPKVNSYTSNWTATRGERSYTINNFNNNNNGWNFIKTGHKTSDVTGTITTNEAMAEIVTDVIVNIDSSSKSYMASKVIAFTLEISSSSDFSEVTTTISRNIKTGENRFAIPTPAADCYYRITIDCLGNNNDNGFVVVSSVTYNGYTPTQLKPVEPRNIEQTQEFNYYNDTHFYLYISADDIQWLKDNNVSYVKVNDTENFGFTGTYGEVEPKKQTKGFMFDGDKLQVFAPTMNEMATLSLTWYNEADELIAKTTATRTILEKIEYSVTEVLLRGNGEKLGLEITINKELPENAKIELTIGGRAVTATHENGYLGYVIKCEDILPITAGTTVAIVLKINGSEPTAWAGVQTSETVVIDPMEYTLTTSEDGKPSVKAESKEELPKEFTGVYGGLFINQSATLQFWANIKNYSESDIRGAKLKVGTYTIELAKYTTAASGHVQFEFDLSSIKEAFEATEFSLEIAGENHKLNIWDGAEWTSSYTDEANHLVFQLSGKQGEIAKLTVTGGEEPEPEFSYGVENVTLEGGEKVTLKVTLKDVTGGEVTEAKIQINGGEAVNGTVAGNVLTFDLTSKEGGTITLTVNDKAYAGEWPTLTPPLAVELNGSTYTLSADSATLTLTVAQIEYIVKFSNDNGGTGYPVEQKVSYGNSVNLNELDKPTKDGFKFSYWYYMEGDAEKEIKDDSIDPSDPQYANAYDVGTHTLTLHAKFEEDKPAITGVTFDFTDKNTFTANGTALTATTAKTPFETACGKSADYEGISSVSQLYSGNNTNGGAHSTENDETNGFIRLGAKSSSGYFTLTFKKEVEKVEIVAEGWTAGTDASIKVENTSAGSSSSKPENQNQTTYSYTIPATKSIKVEASARCFIFSITVTFAREKTPQEKVDETAKSYTLPDEYKTFSAVKEYDLPTTTTPEGTTISWALKNGSSEYCEVTANGTKLNVTSLPKDSDKEVVLTATFTFSGAIATNDFTVKIIKEGGAQKLVSGTFVIGKSQVGGAASGYENRTWTAQSADKEYSLTGSTFAAYNSNNLQFATKQKGYYFVSKSATPAPITNITINGVAEANNGNYTWHLLTSKTGTWNDLTTGIPSGGTEQDTKSGSLKTVSWNLSGEDTYFAIYVTNANGTTGQIYFSDIVISYSGMASVSSDQGMESPSMTAFTANMNNGNVESNGLWIALAVGGSALIALSALAVVVLLRKHN